MRAGRVCLCMLACLDCAAPQSSLLLSCRPMLRTHHDTLIRPPRLYDPHLKCTMLASGTGFELGSLGSVAKETYPSREV